MEQPKTFGEIVNEQLRFYSYKEQQLKELRLLKPKNYSLKIEQLKNYNMLEFIRCASQGDLDGMKESHNIIKLYDYKLMEKIEERLEKGQKITGHMYKDEIVDMENVERNEGAYLRYTKEIGIAHAARTDMMEWLATIYIQHEVI
jgi:hypothetical protein